MIPPDLLHAVSADGGGQLSLVIGAGCSVPEPTNIPFATALSLDAHRRLVQDGVLANGECNEPDNLAALATLTFNKKGSQNELVRRFPLDRLRLARPNEGYKLLAALMAEGAVAHVLSLNFDLAIENAASELGVTLFVTSAPGAQVPVRAALVHLHGSVNSPSDELVLRQSVINNAWKASWQQVVAQQILAAPNILFAGLGSPAPVLSETVEMVHGALGNQKAFYQVDISEHGANYFAQQLNVTVDHYVQTGWCEIMRRLATRVVEEQVQSLLTAGSAVLHDNGVELDQVARFKEVAGRLRKVSLLTLGRFRAHARLSRASAYLPRSLPDEEWMAMPLLALANICEHTGRGAEAAANGLWLLRLNGKTEATLLIATGRGTRKLVALESAIWDLCREIAESSAAAPDIVLLGGVVASITAAEAAPVDIVEDEEPEDIISGPGKPLLLMAESADVLPLIEEWLHGG
jgi:hypothetical protein